MRQTRFSLLLLTLWFAGGCQSSCQHTNDNLYWVDGHPFPWVASSIRQTSLETNFFGSVDVMLQNGLRAQLRTAVSVTIDPVAMWAIFSYPAKTDLEFESTLYEDVDEMSGWVLSPDGSFRESSNTNNMQFAFVRKRDPVATMATAELIMLLRVQSADFTNFITAVLPCVWHAGALETQGLKVRALR